MITFQVGVFGWVQDGRLKGGDLHQFDSMREPPGHFEARKRLNMDNYAMLRPLEFQVLSRYQRLRDALERLNLSTLSVSGCVEISEPITSYERRMKPHLQLMLGAGLFSDERYLQDLRKFALKIDGQMQKRAEGKRRGYPWEEWVLYKDIWNLAMKQVVNLAERIQQFFDNNQDFLEAIEIHEQPLLDYQTGIEKVDDDDCATPERHGVE